MQFGVNWIELYDVDRYNRSFQELHIWNISSEVERLAVNQYVTGSIPVCSVIRKYKRERGWSELL